MQARVGQSIQYYVDDDGTNDLSLLSFGPTPCKSCLLYVVCYSAFVCKFLNALRYFGCTIEFKIIILQFDVVCSTSIYAQANKEKKIQSVVTKVQTKCISKMWTQGSSSFENIRFSIICTVSYE